MDSSVIGTRPGITKLYYLYKLRLVWVIFEDRLVSRSKHTASGLLLYYIGYQFMPYTVAYRGGVSGVQTPSPPQKKSFGKLSRVPSSVENISVTTLDIPKVWQSRTGLQIEQNPW
jgi:hypothetical protein